MQRASIEFNYIFNLIISLILIQALGNSCSSVTQLPLLT